MSDQVKKTPFQGIVAFQAYCASKEKHFSQIFYSQVKDILPERFTDKKQAVETARNIAKLSNETEYPVSSDFALEAVARYYSCRNWHVLSAKIENPNNLFEKIEKLAEKFGSENDLQILNFFVDEEKYNLLLLPEHVRCLKLALDLNVKFENLDYSDFTSFYGSPNTVKTKSVDLLENSEDVVNGLLVKITAMMRENMLPDQKQSTHTYSEQLKSIAQKLEVQDGLLCLTLTDKQANIIIKSCDCISRVLMGQKAGIMDALIHKGVYITENGALIESHVNWIHQLLTGYQSNASMGINNPGVSDDARILYDIQQVIRYQISKDNNYDRYSVWNNTPTQSSQQPLPKITVKNIEPEPEFKP